VKIVA